MNVRVIKADPFHNTVGLVMPAITQRVIDYAKQHVPECDPVNVAKNLLTPLYAQDPRILVLALVDERATVVGHVIASLQSDGVKTWVNIVQYRADGNVGDAGLDALETVDRWARANKATSVLLVTTSDDKRWDKRGYEPTRIIRHRPVGELPANQPVLP